MSSDVLLQTIDTLTQDVVQRDLTIKALRLTIEKLKIELTHLKRMRYGRSSEKMEAAQVQLELLSAALAPLLPVSVPTTDSCGANVADLDAERKKRSKRAAQPQQGLPAHLPREDVVHSGCAPDCKCGACGTGLQRIGQDVSEVLDYEPGSFKVIRHIRPKFVCSQCHTITQEAAPSRPINRCLAGAGLLAQVLVSKYCDHIPLYRQNQIYARAGVHVERSTQCDWVILMRTCAMCWSALRTIPSTGLLSCCHGWWPRTWAAALWRRNRCRWPPDLAAWHNIAMRIKLIEDLPMATSAELYQLSWVIDQLLADPRRIVQARTQLHTGQPVQFFDWNTGKLKPARVIAMKDRRVTLLDDASRSHFTVPYEAIMLTPSGEPMAATSATPASTAHTKPSPPPEIARREDFRIGNRVSFTDRDLQQRVGLIVRINQRTATLDCDGQTWRVAFGLLRHLVDI